MRNRLEREMALEELRGLRQMQIHLNIIQMGMLTERMHTVKARFGIIWSTS